MIKLFKIKDQKKEDVANGVGRGSIKRQSAGELRLHKDMSELNLPKTTTISFPNGKNDLMNFEISIRPDEGYYQGGKFKFTSHVSPSYPHEPPKVKCKTKVYHPNIDLEGNVCLNILREDWKPVLNINTVVYGLNLLFTPNQVKFGIGYESEQFFGSWVVWISYQFGESIQAVIRPQNCSRIELFSCNQTTKTP